MGVFPNFRGENEKSLKPPPRGLVVRIFLTCKKAGSPNDLPPGNVLRRVVLCRSPKNPGVWFWFFHGDFIDIFISWDPGQLVYLPTSRLIFKGSFVHPKNPDSFKSGNF